MIDKMVEILKNNALLKATASGTQVPVAGMEKATARQTIDSTAYTAKEASREQLDTIRGNTYGQLTKGRPLVEGMLGISDDTSEASRISAATGLPGANSGDQDTMRHLSLSARLKRKHPLIAEPAQTGHEVLGFLGAQTRAEMKRDLSNNEIGRKIGENVDTDKQGDEAAYDLASGPMSLNSAMPYVKAATRQKLE